MSNGREKRGEDVTNRLSQRFGDEPEEDAESDESAENEQSSQNSKNHKNSMTEANTQSADSVESAQTDNIKDRPSVLMYLTEEIHSELDLRFDELNLQHKREHGEALEKNRDFYPAVIKAALEGKEIQEVLEEER